MVCPLRIVVFAASLVLVLGSLTYFAFADEQPAFLAARPSRTWLQFIRAFFTGELLIHAWYGPPAVAAGEGGGAVAAEKAVGGQGAEQAPPAPGAPAEAHED